MFGLEWEIILILKKSKYKFIKCSRSADILLEDTIWSNSNIDISGYEDKCYYIKSNNGVCGYIIVEKMDSSVYLTFFMKEIFFNTDFLYQICKVIFNKLEDCEAIRIRIIKNDFIGKTLLKLSGFKLDLIRRKHFKINGKYLDLCYYSKYKSDYN